MSEEFLEWLEEQGLYYVSPSEVEKKFPDLNLNMIGTTMKLDEENDEWVAPIRDYRQAIKYGQVYD